MSVAESPASLLTCGETKLNITEVAVELGVMPPSVARWIVTGKKVKGRFIRLEGVLIGRTWHTTREAVSRWTNAVTASALAGTGA